MKNNNRPISNGLKGFPKHTVRVSGYPKKQKPKNTKKKYNKNKAITIVALYILIPVSVTIITYFFVSFVK